MTALALALRESGRWSATIPAISLLTKPRIILLLLATTVPAMVVAEGGWPSTALVIATLVGGAASQRGRTQSTAGTTATSTHSCGGRSRAARSGRDPAAECAPLWRCAGRGGVCLPLGDNEPAGGVLAAAAFLFYVFVYTVWLKRRSSQNIVIGGAAGAFPPMVGWAAVTGELAWAPVIMFAIIFFWTPPPLSGR